jgi:hypothetical protein
MANKDEGIKLSQFLRTSAAERLTKIVLNASLKPNFMTTPYRKLSPPQIKSWLCPCGRDRELQSVWAVKYILNSARNKREIWCLQQWAVNLLAQLSHLMQHMPSKSSEFLQQSQCYCTPGLWSFTSNEHGTDAEYLLRCGVGRNIAKPDASETRTCEIKSCDVWLWMCYIVYRNIKPLSHRMDPTCKTKNCVRFFNFWWW